ncbi:hypothetical protein ZHAS_00015840 [Anopheles sinensis]|uniref:Uncharacterized protein n=1 Tax=Anopheles sinensis TaxID=74873 RepID=A0A084WC26_ANOSI|nr:hypothetical protein ZHAS_00015840 [Anopheles sinensis]
MKTLNEPLAGSPGIGQSSFLFSSTVGIRFAAFLERAEDNIPFVCRRAEFFWSESVATECNGRIESGGAIKRERLAQASIRPWRLGGFL